MIWENGIETCIISYKKLIASPGLIRIQEAWGWCTGMTQRDGMGRHWVWCIGRGPHLQLRQEPQGTSDFRLRSQGPCRLGTGESGLVLG